MVKWFLFCGALILILTISSVSASTYLLDYTQVGNKVVVKEAVDGVKISNYVSPELLDRSRGGYFFVEKLVFNQSYSNAEIRLNLDEGFILEDSEAYPAGYLIESDGRTISLVWKLENVQKNQVLAIFVKLEQTNKAALLWIILVVLLVILFGYLLFNRFSKPKIKTKAQVQITKTREAPREKEKYEYLLDTEKKVLELLKSADRNELWQKQIQDSTGFSKAKVSRLVRNLEARNLVSKIPFGNTNKVRLK